MTNLHIKSPLLSFSNVYFSSDNKTLLNNCNASVTYQDRIMLSGKSGSGKSLLFAALAGQLPHDGQVNLFDISGGKLVQAHTQPSVWRAKVALLTQSPVMIDGTVLDNLALPFGFKFYKNRQIDTAWLQKQLAAFGKSPDFLTQSTTNLSGGERQIVHFLRTLQLDAHVLLLDEPTAALDEASSRVLWTMVNDWVANKADRAALAISHRHEDICYFDRLWQMTEGVLTPDRVENLAGELP